MAGKSKKYSGILLESMPTNPTVEDMQDVLNGIEVQPSKVLLFESDAPDTLLKERPFKLCSNVDDTKFKYVNRFNTDNSDFNIDLASEDGRKNIEIIIKESGCDFVIFDTLISFINDECDPKEIKPCVDFLRTVAKKYNCHILVCHHSRKRESKDRKRDFEQSDMIGTSILNRLASFILGVDKINGEENKSVLRIKKSWFKLLEPITFEVKDVSKDKIEIVYDIFQDENVNDRHVITETGVRKEVGVTKPLRFLFVHSRKNFGIFSKGCT